MKPRPSVRLIAVLTASLSFPALCFAQQAGVDPRPPNGKDQKPAFSGQTDAPEKKAGVAFDVVTVAEGLVNPWGLAFLPNGKMLVTERPGRLRIVNADGTMSEPVAGLPPVLAQGQGGLLDIALDPAFAKNGLIYWSYSEAREDGTNNTAVARGKLVDEATPRVENVWLIYHQTPFQGSRLHYGSRLVFARDGTLFITQGDRSNTPGRMQAQNLDTLIGKIARVNTDGTIPANNPYRTKAIEGKPAGGSSTTAIYSIGHRNIQAAALHPTTGELWEIEHGTRGGDELNIVRPGRDYGWPTIAYGIEYNGGTITGGITAKEGMQQPTYYWDPVIGPSGMAFYTADAFPEWKGSLFVGGHATRDLVRLTLNRDRVVGEERLLADRKDRIRDVRQGPDGALYLLTDDAKGKILKLVPKK